MRNVDGAGILFDNLSGIGNIGRCNTITDCGECGIKIRQVSLVYSNIIKGSTESGIEMTANTDDGGDVYNNTIYHSGSGAGIWQGADAGTNTKTNIYNNVVVSVAGAGNGIYIHNHGGTASDYANENHNCVYGWSAANDFVDDVAAIAAGANSIIIDPKFVDAANNDYHLLLSSP